MALTPDQKEELKDLVQKRLDEAEAIWEKVGHKLTLDEAEKAMRLQKAETVPSKIPGHKTVSDDDPQVDEFIALVGDMRDSSKHLLCAISSKTADASELQRVFYETSALLPALAQTVRFEQGQVTEYLGDGVLALFQVNDEDPSLARKAAYHAARNCIDETLIIVNMALANRYRLPPLEIGIGLSQSRAVVTLIGLDHDKHPKAIGRCVYTATKLSGGRNQIAIDEGLYQKWPTSKGGQLKFVQKQYDDIKGYAIAKSVNS
jgi:hypothetical protein